MIETSKKNEIQLQEAQAIEYINNVVLPKLQHQGDEIQAESFLQEAVFNCLKSMALNWIGKALEELKLQATAKAVDLADWLLERLQDLLFSQYQSANDEQKEIFRGKIFEKFPNSPLADKLRNN